MIISSVWFGPNLTRDTHCEAQRVCPAPKGKGRFGGRSRKKSRPSRTKPRAIRAGDLLWKEPEKQRRAAPAGRGISTERVTEVMAGQHLEEWRSESGASQPGSGEDADRTTANAFIVSFRMPGPRGRS